MRNCKKCKNRLLRAYIRINIENKRIWLPIGYYCQSCKKLYRSR